MSMNNQPSDERLIRARYQTLLIVWAAQFMALLGFLFLALFIFEAKAETDSTLSWILSGASLLPVVISFPVKQQLLAQAVEKQSPALVQQAVIIAMALCEAGGLLGLVARAMTGSSYFFFPFAFAALGMLLHFPRREQLLAAYFRNRI